MFQCMLVQCALQDKFLVAPSFRVYLSSREPSFCWWSGRSFGWLVTNRRAREGNLRGEISCLFTHRRASLILFLIYELGKTLRSLHWPTDSAALPPAVGLPDMIVPASRCWRAERQRLPVIFPVLHHCGIFSLSVHLIISTLFQADTMQHLSRTKGNSGGHDSEWSSRVPHHVTKRSPPIRTNCVWKSSYKM